MPFQVPFRELVVAGIVGFFFGVIGYYTSRHIGVWVGRQLP